MAGFAGVAATGVVIVRAERRRRAYTPEEVRDRLRAKAAEANAEPPAVEPVAASAPAAPRRRRAARRAADRLARLLPGRP
nr:hypothetical protein [Actinorugispora endophytica]